MLVPLEAVTPRSELIKQIDLAEALLQCRPGDTLFGTRLFVISKSDGIAASSQQLRASQVCRIAESDFFDLNAGVLAVRRLPTPSANHPRVVSVIGPEGSRLTIADLPEPGVKRWGPRRKAEVIAAVRGGLISLEEVCNRYDMTVDELLSWQRSLQRSGPRRRAWW